MKNIVIIVLFFCSIYATGQENDNCDNDNRHSKKHRGELIEKLDSVINYYLEPGTQNFIPSEIFIYEFDKSENYPVIEKLSLPSRSRENRQNYFYDETGRKDYYILQIWSGSEYVNRNRTDYYYDEQGKLSREVYSGVGPDASWIPYQQHFFSYDENDRILNYRRQMKNSIGEWYDFSYRNYFYNTSWQLIEFNEQRIADGLILSAQQYTYDESGRVSTRVKQTLKYFPTEKKSVMTNQTRQIFSYDIFGEMSSYTVDAWENNTWILTGKSQYFRSLIHGKKVEICHNGHAIVVSVNAVEAHLRHGDKLGSCNKDNSDNHDRPLSNKKDDCYESGSIEMTIYPNPFKSEINIEISGRIEEYTHLTIYSKAGTLIHQEELYSRKKISLDLPNLQKGVYYLTIYGFNGIMTKTIVKK
jgi:hypothetical protein